MSEGRRPPQQVLAGAARFVDSVDRPGPAGPPEVALAGRSNVGKSSLLNALASRRRLAFTSKTPGRTQRINLFDLELRPGGTVRLVDLPGYGHAEAPEAVTRGFGPMIEGYLLGSSTLRAVVLLFDARRGADEIGLQFAAWLAREGLRVQLVATKVDAIAVNRRIQVVQAMARAAGQPFLATSVRAGLGLDDLRARIAALAFGEGA